MVSKFSRLQAYISKIRLGSAHFAVSEVSRLQAFCRKIIIIPAPCKLMNLINLTPQSCVRTSNEHILPNWKENRHSDVDLFRFSIFTLSPAHLQKKSNSAQLGLRA